jgi:hypothetical protein
MTITRGTLTLRFTAASFSEAAVVATTLWRKFSENPDAELSPHQTSYEFGHRQGDAELDVVVYIDIDGYAHPLSGGTALTTTV